MFTNDADIFQFNGIDFNNLYKRNAKQNCKISNQVPISPAFLGS
jgi:hypothetical protein